MIIFREIFEKFLFFSVLDRNSYNGSSMLCNLGYVWVFYEWI